MTKLLRYCLVLALFSIMASGISIAQSKETGVVLGQVLDTEGAPLPGANVTIASPSMMGTRAVVTENEGKFRFGALSTGTYTIEVSLTGFATVKKTNVAVHAGATSTVDVTLVPAKLETEVLVTGAAPIVDVSDASMAKTYLTKEMLENLPTSQTAGDLINLAPGISEGSAYGGGQATGNSYQMDGVELSDSWLGSGIYTTPIDYNVIEETQVVALGAPAEYGNFTGAMMNIVTKSGGNKFSGDLNVLYRGMSWQSENIDAADPKWRLLPEAPVTNLFDVSMHLGGPIIKDKLWFFGGYEFSKTKSVIESANKTMPITFPKAFVKLTYQPNESDRIQGFFDYHNRTARHVSTNPLYLDEANYDVLYPVYIGNLSFLHIFSPSTLMEVKVAGYKMNWDELPSSGNLDVSGHVDAITGIHSVNYSDITKFYSNRLNATASVSHNADNFLGSSHDFKMGVEFEKSDGGGDYHYLGPDQVKFIDYNSQPYLAYQIEYKKAAVNYRGTFYFQDDWKIGKSLFVNPGLRYNIYKGLIPDLPKSERTVFKTNGFEPRLGFVWDILKSHKTVFKAHYGRYLEGTKTYFIDSMTPSGDWVMYLVNPDWSLGPEIYRLVGLDLYSVDPNIKQPHMDAIAVGLEQVLGKDLSASATFIYRKWGNPIEAVETAAIFVPMSFTDPVTGQVYTVYNQTNPGTNHYLITNPKAGKDIGAATPDIVGVTPWRKYTGVEFSINKRFADNWQLHASYTYGNEKGTYANTGMGHNTPGSGVAKTYKDPTYQINIEGRSPISPTHVLKVQGTYIFPLGISMSASYNYSSGRTWTRNVRVSGVKQSKPYLMTEPLGSRFMPATNNLDLRLDKSFSFNNYSLSLTLDMFNVFNQGRETKVNDVDAAGSTTFGLATADCPPRTFRAGLRFRF